MTSKRYKLAPVSPAVLVNGYWLPGDHPTRKGIQIYGEALKTLAGTVDTHTNPAGRCLVPGTTGPKEVAS